MPYSFMPLSGNLVGLCQETPGLVVSPALDTLTPIARAFDGRPSTAIRFGSKAAAPGIGVVLNFLSNPGFEVDLTGWTLGAGTSVRTTTAGEFFAGVGALKFTSAGFRYQDIVVPAGNPCTLLAALRGDGVNSVYVVIQNLDTGRQLNAAGTAWVASDSQALLIRSANSFAAATLGFTVEPFSATGTYRTRLRVFIVAQATACFADEVRVRPSWNFAALLGHNLTGSGEYQTPGTTLNYYGQVPVWDLDGAEFGWLVPSAPDTGLVDGAAYAIPRPNTWHKWTTAKTGGTLTLSAKSDQSLLYPQVSFGELVIGYVQDFVVAPKLEMTLDLEEAGQIRNSTPAGDVYGYSEGPRHLRELGLRFILNTDAPQLQLSEQIQLATRGGRDGLIIVPPVEMASAVGCIAGLIDARHSYGFSARTGTGYVREAALRLTELPSPGL
jgi:hypothetical protein